LEAVSFSRIFLLETYTRIRSREGQELRKKNVLVRFYLVLIEPVNLFGTKLDRRGCSENIGGSLHRPAGLAIALTAVIAQQKSPADDQFMASMEKMNKAMSSANDADPAAAWAKKMIEHHRGGIEMSEIVLKHSKDPVINKQAKKTTDAQKKEIRELEAWLSKKNKR
jgi:hypothetical protein